ncbi:MAG: META domain-containing protein, partial [Actinobacteria bacterium]
TLTAWSVSSASPTGFNITAKFDATQVSGHSAVNTYGGEYKAGPGKAFSFGSLAMTEMAGEPEAMRAEQLYFELLGQVKQYHVSGTTLTLADGNGNPLLVYAQAK